MGAERTHETHTHLLGADQLSGSVFGAWNSEAMETRSSLSKRFQTSGESERPQPRQDGAERVTLAANLRGYGSTVGGGGLSGSKEVQDSRADVLKMR